MKKSDESQKQASTVALKGLASASFFPAKIEPK
jgi:hypothetical protein